MQLSSILKTLEAKALVARTRCPMNARAKQIFLTGGAVVLLADALPRVTALQRTFFGDDPAMGDDLHARLRRVVAGWGETG